MFRLFAAVLALALLGLPAAARASDDGTYDRLYLAGGWGDYLYWTVDPTDPELDVASASWSCGPKALVAERACSGSVHGRFYTNFGPASVLSGLVQHGPEAPVRFHFEADITAEVDYTVHMGLQDGARITVSEAATEVSPGVYEGTLSTRGSWRPGLGNRVYFFVKTPDTRDFVDITLAMAGRSWIELPQALPGASVPELLAAHPEAPEPLTYSTPARSFEFNDAQWEVTTFEGDLREPLDFGVTLPRDAAAVYAWVELFSGPFVYGTAKGSPDNRRLTDSAILWLTRNGAPIAAGESQYNQLGRGNNALAAMGVKAGSVTVRVEPYDRFPQIEGDQPDASHPYKLYVLALYGERTLSRMRWTFEPTIAEPFIPARAQAGTCVNASEPIPTTAAVSTFTVDLDWDTVGMPTADWAVHHSYPNGLGSPCSELGTNDALRITVPYTRVWQVAPTPARGSTFVGWRDTLFTFDVRLWYTPPAV